MISLYLIETLGKLFPDHAITTEATPRSVIVDGTAIDISFLLGNDALEKFHTLAPAHREDILSKITPLIGVVPEAPAPVAEPVVEEPVVEEPVVEEAPAPVVVEETPAPEAPVAEEAPAEAPKKAKKS